MKTARNSRTKLTLTLTAALAGGSICGNCQTTFKDAVVSGARDFVLTELLNPANFIPGVEEDEISTTDSP